MKLKTLSSEICLITYFSICHNLLQVASLHDILRTKQACKNPWHSVLLWIENMNFLTFFQIKYLAKLDLKTNFLVSQFAHILSFTLTPTLEESSFKCKTTEKLNLNHVSFAWTLFPFKTVYNTCKCYKQLCFSDSYENIEQYSM